MQLNANWDKLYFPPPSNEISTVNISIYRDADRRHLGSRYFYQQPVMDRPRGYRARENCCQQGRSKGLSMAFLHATVLSRVIAIPASTSLKAGQAYEI